MKFDDNELRIVVSALDAKCKAQYDKLVNPHLDAKYLTTYKKLYNDVVALHLKFSRAVPDDDVCHPTPGDEDCNVDRFAIKTTIPKQED